MSIAIDRVEIRFRPTDSNGAWVYAPPIPAGQGSVQLAGVERGRSYQIEARSVGANGQASDWVAQTHVVDDATLLPLGPTGLAALSAADTVSLTWTVSGTQRPDVEYEVWRAPDVSGSAGTFTQLGLTRALSFPDHVTDGIRRHYKVRAHDFLGHTTAFSAEAASQGKTSDDGATHGAIIGPAGNVTGAVDASGRAIIDLGSGHFNKTLDFISDSGTRFSVSAIDPAHKALVDLSQSGHTNKNLDNIADTGVRFAALQSGANGDGSQIFSNPEFAGGVLSPMVVYDNNSSGANTLSAVAVAGTPNSSGFVLRITNSGVGTPSPGLGGFVPGGGIGNNSGSSFVPNEYQAGHTYIVRIRAKIPVGYTLTLASNAIGTGGTFGLLTSGAGTGSFVDYIAKYVIGVGGTLSSTGHVYITGPAGAVTWDVAMYSWTDITMANGYAVTAVDGNRRGIIDFTQGHLNKNTDNISDGTGSPLTGGKRGFLVIDSGNIVVTSGIDFVRAYTNKHLGNMPDDAGSLRFAVSALDAARKAIIDFSQGHSNKNVDNIADGATFGRPLLSRLSSGKPWIDFSEAIHANKNQDNVGDGVTYQRSGTQAQDNIVLLGTSAGGGGNTFAYRQFSTQAYVVASGDHLQYDLFEAANNPQCLGGLDFEYGASHTAFRGAGMNDQNGIGPLGDTSAFAKGRWYHRVFDLSSIAGQTVNSWALALEGDTAGNYLMRAANILVVNGSTVKAVIFSSGALGSTPAWAAGGAGADTGYSGVNISTADLSAGAVGMDYHVTDGTTYGRVQNTALTGNLVDMAKSGVVGKAVELVRNPDFESGDRDWTKETGFSIVNDGNAYTGSFAAKWVGSSGAAALRNAIFFAVQPGDTVLAMCMVKRTAGGGNGCVRLTFQDSSNAEIGTPAGNTITSSTYARSRVLAVAPANAVTARVEGLGTFVTTATTLYFDQFYASLTPKSLAEVPDDATTSRFAVSSIDGNRRGIIDFSQGHSNKNIDNVADGASFKRVGATWVDASSRVLIDFSLGAHSNRSQDFIPDGATFFRTTANQRDGGGRGFNAIDSGNIVVAGGLDFARGYTGKHLGNIPDDATSARNAVSAIDAARKALIDFSQGGHSNKNLGNIADASGFFRCKPASPRAVDTPYNCDFEIWSDAVDTADGWTKNFEIAGTGATYARGAGFFGNYGQQIISTAGNGGAVASQPIGVRPNTKYELSARYLSSVAITQGVYIRICWYKDDGDFSRGSASVSAHPLDDVASNVAAGTSWLFGGNTFTSPSDAKYAVVSLYNYNPNVNATVTFDSANFRPADTALVDGGVDSAGNLLLKNVAQANGSTVAPSTASSSYATLAEMSLTKTTKGNAVLVTFSGLFETTGSTGTIWIQLFRDGTAISNEIFQVSPAASQAFVLALSWLDSPSAGSHTFDIRWHGGPTYTSIAIGTSRAMQLVELG